MIRVFNDRQIIDAVRLFGVRPDRNGVYDFLQVVHAIKKAFPGYWLQEYQRFKSPVSGDYFGRWVIGNESRFRSRRRRFR